MPPKITDKNWVPILGSRGRKGEKGDTGPSGFSAYDLTSQEIEDLSSTFTLLSTTTEQTNKSFVANGGNKSK
jgi:hypothetical protein